MTVAPPRTELRCAVASHASGEPLLGTAAPVRSWLLIERPGAWSAAALAETLAEALPADRRRELGALTRSAGLRPLLIRRPGRDSGAASTTVLLGSATPGSSWLERLQLPDLRALADVDVEKLAAAVPGHGEPVDGPAFLVCTHGSKDMCCAVQGRPVARMLAAEHPGSVWECSHVGGDRFAGNVVVAPFGEYYGQLDADSALVVADSARRGLLQEQGFRGRSAYDAWQQAAEMGVRSRRSLWARDDVRCGPSRHDAVHAEVDVSTPTGTVTVRLERRQSVQVQASRCRGALTGVDYAVVEITPP